MAKYKKDGTHFSPLTNKSLPEELRTVLSKIFPPLQGEIVLVGGTALSGFFFGHRRSDDIDLFVKNEILFNLTFKEIQKTKKDGVIFLEEKRFPEYYHALCELNLHKFTIDIVTDPPLFLAMDEIKSFPYNIQTPDIKTLLKMKMATLVSRCSEKDLYDLIFLLKHFNELTLPELIIMGQEIDLGVNIDSLTLSIGGTNLKEDACDFSIDRDISNKNIYAQILSFQKLLLKQLLQLSRSIDDNKLETIGSVLKKIKSI